MNVNANTSVIVSVNVKPLMNVCASASVSVIVSVNVTPNEQNIASYGPVSFRNQTRTHTFEGN